MASDMPARPVPPSEAALIRLVRLAAGMSVADAAVAAGISKARWSQVENGYESRNGDTHPVSGSDGVVARMAAAVGLDADRLQRAGRPGAAAVLREIGRRKAQRPDTDLTPRDAYERGVVDSGISAENVRLLFEIHRQQEPGDDDPGNGSPEEGEGGAQAACATR